MHGWLWKLGKRPSPPFSKLPNNVISLHGTVVKDNWASMVSGPGLCDFARGMPS